MPQSETLNMIIENMESVIVGKRKAIELALITLLSDGHLLLEDVPGVGKTTLGKALAQSIQCSFARIQFTPDTLPGDVIGMSMYQMQTGEFSYIPGAVMNDILLADEINRTSPKTQASLLEAMEEQQVTVDGTTYALPGLFMVIAAQNPVEQLGTYRLPEAAGPFSDEDIHGISRDTRGRGRHCPPYGQRGTPEKTGSGHHQGGHPEDKGRDQNCGCA